MKGVKELDAFYSFVFLAFYTRNIQSHHIDLGFTNSKMILSLKLTFCVI